MPARAGLIGFPLFVAAIALLPLSGGAQEVPVEGSVVEAVRALRAGEFIWQERVAPEGPLLLVVALRTQRAILYRNGVPIAASTVSTGRPGYATPAGIYSVLQKRAVHYSSTYDNAPMPYMQRLTWKGIALHAGTLPGYPASHGCIRLPKGFAKKLFETSSVGMTVVVTNSASVPRVAPTPQVAFTGGDGETGSATDGLDWHPELSPEGPISIVVSAADKRAVVLRNGRAIGSSPVSIKGAVKGGWAYQLARNGTQPEWVRIGFDQSPSSRVEPSEWKRFDAPDNFKRAVASIIVPGTVIIVTSDSLRSGAEPVDLLEED